MSELAPEPEALDKIYELMRSLGKPGVAVYIDIYPIDYTNPTEYTYDYWETKASNRTTTEDFLNGTE